MVWTRHWDRRGLVVLAGAWQAGHQDRQTDIDMPVTSVYAIPNLLKKRRKGHVHAYMCLSHILLTISHVSPCILWWHALPHVYHKGGAGMFSSVCVLSGSCASFLFSTPKVGGEKAASLLALACSLSCECCVFLPASKERHLPCFFL